MTRYVVRRLGASLLLLAWVVSLTFFLVHLAPGDPTLLLPQRPGSRQAMERLTRLYGLDRPLLEQYLGWLRAAATGDWGVSWSRGVPVRRVLARTLPNSLLLVAAASLVQYGLGLALGIAAARRRGRLPDHLIRLGSLGLYSVPLFWLGLMAVLAASRTAGWLPAGNMTSAHPPPLSTLAGLADLGHHLLLPALVLGLGTAGATVRFVRNSLLDVLGRDYIRTARAKGLPPRRVLWVHALRNAAPPLVHLAGVSLPAMLSGTLIIEVVFGWPGMGRLTYDAASARDYPLILAATALTGALVVAGTLLADLAHAAIDPRVRERMEPRPTR